MEKKEAAWHLYKEGLLQKDIARILNVSEQTVVSWKQKADWDKKLHEHKELHDSNAQRILKLIAYQLRTIERMVQRWEEENNDRLIGKGEIDALSKLYATIKSKETTWSNYIKVCKDLMEFIASKDLPLAKVLTEKIDEFLNETRENINAN